MVRCVKEMIPLADKKVEDLKPKEAERLARLQADKLAADLVTQGGYKSMADRKIIALVAYLQRLGTDLGRAPDWNPNADFAAPVIPAAEVKGK